MNHTTQAILAAVDACFASSPTPPTSGDIAAAVLRAAAPELSTTEARDWLYACADRLDGALSKDEARLGFTDTELEAEFRSWWAQSYPTPPGPHALMTHTSWARHLLQLGGQQQQPEQPQ